MRMRILFAIALLALAGAVAVATAAPSVSTPTITSGPAAATNQTSASFAFKGSGNVTFQCSLDGAAFAACTSPKSYAGPLAQGHHAFQVRARNASGQLSSPATWSWTIDTQPPPAPALTQTPPALSASTRATFAFTDADSGVQFLCKLDTGAYAACTSPASLSGLAQGTHTFSVKARDAAGNVGPATSYAWKVDTVAPPAPKITQRPSNPSSSGDATFAFTDAEAGVAFRCSLDGAAFAACSSPKTYTALAAGSHTFQVRARDAAGNDSAPASFSWQIVQSTGLPFTIIGSYAGLLAPGRSGPLQLTLSNPNSAAITVTSLTVTVQPGSSQAGCDGLANLQLTQSNVSSTNTVTVPAGGSVTLPAGTVSAPQLLMRDLTTNQDACKGATFSFSYAGSAHS